MKCFANLDREPSSEKQLDKNEIGACCMKHRVKNLGDDCSLIYSEEYSVDADSFGFIFFW